MPKSHLKKTIIILLVSLPVLAGTLFYTSELVAGRIVSTGKADAYEYSIRGDSNSSSKQDNQFGNGKSANRPRLLSSSWRVPLNGGVWTATCSSAAHNNNRSRYAIDVGRPVGTSVYASNSGSIVFAGWDTSGYGNLVKMTTGSYTHYYAHLSNFDYNTILSYPYWYAYHSQRIGYVGNTGNSSGAHLHFEIRNSANNGVSLIGMSGFTATNYPYPGNPCGTVSY